MVGRPGYRVLCGVLGDRVYLVWQPERGRPDCARGPGHQRRLPTGLSTAAARAPEPIHCGVLGSNTSFVAVLLPDEKQPLGSTAHPRGPSTMSPAGARELPQPLLDWSGFGYAGGCNGVWTRAEYFTNTSVYVWLYTFSGSTAYHVNASITGPGTVAVHVLVEDIISQATVLELEKTLALDKAVLQVRRTSPIDEAMDGRVSLYLPVGTEKYPWLHVEIDASSRSLHVEPAEEPVLQEQSPTGLVKALGTDNPMTVEAASSRGGYNYLADITYTDAPCHNPYGFATFLAVLDSRGRVAQVKILPDASCAAAPDNTTIVVEAGHGLKAYRRPTG